MFKVYNKNTGACFTPFSSVSIVDIEQENVSCVKYINFKLLAKCLEWKDEAQISVIQRNKICLYYVLKMEKFPNFSRYAWYLSKNDTLHTPIYNLKSQQKFLIKILR